MTAIKEKMEFRLPKRMQGLQPTLIRQFFERALPDSINFGLGEPDLPTPQFLRDEAARIARDEQNGYTSHPGIPALRDLIAESGFREVTETVHFNSLFGTIRLLKAKKKGEKI